VENELTRSFVVAKAIVFFLCILEGNGMLVVCDVDENNKMKGRPLVSQ
jgi:hypothetical protein